MGFSNTIESPMGFWLIFIIAVVVSLGYLWFERQLKKEDEEKAVKIRYAAVTVCAVVLAVIVRNYHHVWCGEIALVTCIVTLGMLAVNLRRTVRGTFLLAAANGVAYFANLYLIFSGV